MTTRFNADSKGGLPSGYNNHNHSSFVVPTCGIEDVDRAMFNLFDKDLNLNVSSQEAVTPVKTIFAAGEKWAMIKKKKDIRDKNGRLILPLITIGRTNVEQDSHKDITGRGINQQTGELKIRRKLSTENDRGYQNLINRLFLNNQSNVSVNRGTKNLNADQQLMSDREIGDLTNDLDVADGALLKPPTDKNIWETITIPAPQFFSAHYEVTIWTQYTEHMNQILESLLAAQLPQGNAYKIANPLKSNYWFIATIDENSYKPNNNWDDMFEQDRIIKYEMSMTVPGYMLVPVSPNAPLAVRRYVSSAQIEFKTSLTDDMTNVQQNDILNPNVTSDPWLGADDPTLPFDHINQSRTQRKDSRLTDENRLDALSHLNKVDPAKSKLKRGQQPDKYLKVATTRSGQVSYRNIKIRNVNKTTGESIISAGDFSLDGISFILDK